jgi:hypothetical protein
MSFSSEVIDRLERTRQINREYGREHKRPSKKSRDQQLIEANHLQAYNQKFVPPDRQALADVKLQEQCADILAAYGSGNG